MREILHLNRDWDYKESFHMDDVHDYEAENGYISVDIPHTNKILPYNCFDEEEYQFVSCYRKEISFGEKLRDRRLILRFEGVMAYAEVYLNGVFQGFHKGGYTPFQIEITESVELMKNNLLVVKVDSRERPDIPPFGHVVDYLTYGGIYREVSLLLLEKVYIEDVFHKTERNEKTWTLSSDITLDNRNACETDVTISIEMHLDDSQVLRTEKEILLIEGKNDCNIELGIEDEIIPWDIDNPMLYTVVTKISYDGKEMDSVSHNIGFRTIGFESDGFYLNEERIKLTGLNRHQSFPYVGYAMPRRVQEKDAEILKFDLGLNMVRTSHYPQSSHFLRRCDEIGLLVFEEIPGWQHIGGSDWKDVCYGSLKEMILRDRNHASIIMWGVRINESPDDDHFYKETNRLAHEMDSTRPTGGVRCILNSQLLEDVYTMNDFIYDGTGEVLRNQKGVTGLKERVPYLVSEFNGHMFPTKRFDNEQRLLEHALRHLKVMDNQMGMDGVSGAIGWCAFDYNTHSDFGSGDKICYHGVMDMFRITKYAAYAYASQISPKKRVTMEIASLCAKGEMDKARMYPIHVFTNCDYVHVYKEGEFLGKFEHSHEYENIQYPPVVVDVKGGERWGDKDPSLTFVGMLDGEAVIRRTLGGKVYGYDLIMEPDNDTLICNGDTFDATRVVVKAVDQYGNILPFINDYVSFSVYGHGRLMGPCETALVGGALGVWIRTTKNPGEIHLRCRTGRFGIRDIQISAVER